VSISVSPGSVLVAFGATGPDSGLLWELSGAGVQFCADPGRKTLTFWSPFRHPKFQKAQRSLEKQCPESIP